VHREDAGALPAGSLYHAQAVRRLAEELRLIEHHKLSGFFLVYHDLSISRARSRPTFGAGSRRASGNLLPGRDAAPRLLHRVLSPRPVPHRPDRQRALSGRFLNESLASVPDIDLDFPREIRERADPPRLHRYGTEHAGWCARFLTYRLRSAVREIGKALDLPLGEIELVAKLADGGRTDCRRTGTPFQVSRDARCAALEGAVPARAGDPRACRATSPSIPAA